ncbi:MAG: alanine racemase [Candidatus Omnitrophota bacterium]
MMTPNRQQSRVGYRPTWAEIDLDNLSYNFDQIKKKLSPGIKVMACVKAEAYGHGLIPVARQLVSCGVDFLAVASIDEAISLRKAGIESRILVLGMTLEQNVGPLFEYSITPTVCSLSLAKELDRQARSRDRIIDIHLKIDTGMGRIGVTHDKAFAFVKKIFGFSNIRVEGIFTHLACADTDDKLTHRQIHVFDSLIKRLKKRSFMIPLVHAANSMGVVSYKSSHFNMVRPGLILYGLRPAEGLPIDLKPVMSLKTRVIYVKNVSRGCGVSYGHTYVTRSATRIATLPIGYGDGYPRNLSNIAPVVIGGKKFTIAGRVCMDQIMVDVGLARVRVGDEVVLIGSQMSQSVSAESLAAFSRTIPYEIVCGIGSRVPRIYVGKSVSRRDAGSRARAGEKRLAPRRSRSIPVRFLDSPSLASTVGITEDISAAGLKVSTPDRILPYRRIALSLESGNNKPVYVSGTPVWSRPASNGRYVSGIKFSAPLAKIVE